MLVHQKNRLLPINSQRGVVLMLLLLLVSMGALAVFVSGLNRAAVQLERDKVTAAALAQAKEALIGDAASQSTVNLSGLLRLPDLGFGPIVTTLSEGNAAPNFTGNTENHSVIGKIPWKNLGISALRDGQGECLWYVVSGRFKKTPVTDVLNWDTQGQIDVIDGNGNAIANNVIALVVSPGRILDGQGHALSDPVYRQCGGNYDARNYLDSFAIADAISGEVNYFTGNTNNRVALDANNKRFVMAANDHYNDRFLMITAEDLFRPIIRRSDFALQISSFLDDAEFHAHLQTVAVTGQKGTDSVNCNAITLVASAENKTFCNNWKEMLLLTALAVPAPITIDGAPSPTACSRVLIFGGKKSGAQVRQTVADKAAPANYLEGANKAAFATPVAASSNFIGASTFDANTPSFDLLRCL
ncbi:MAG: hypothetical protein Q8O38_07170 [Sulfurimicrobium sp.]|nr:hypothetical protein [Sulfurimicrobium sp.]